MSESVPSAESDAGLIPLVRALWLAHNETDDIPIDLAWDDLPEPQRTNWLAVGKAARARGVAQAAPPLTEAEQDVIQLAGELWNAMCAAIPDGPTRSSDLAELVPHVHAIQHAFMANAAARAYPAMYRSLGSTLQTTVTSPEASAS